ncbi:MAG TPA: OmpA family protein [Polyangiaceae bacterium]
MRRRRLLLSEHEGTREIWPAFTDVMSTLALILFVLVLLSFVRSLVSSKRLEAFQRQIAASALELEGLRGEIQAGKAELAASQATLQRQQAVITDSDRQLDTLRTQLQSIAVLRVAVLNKLKQAIEAQLGPSNPSGTALVTIGDNGDIVINESLVFEYNSYAIKKEGKPLLDTLAKALANVLADPDVRANIDTILIQGHTDERGSASVNWDLSARRATAVLDYLFEADKTLADSYGSYFAASAYSKFRPIDRAATEPAYQRNRRIEISVIPRDDNVRKVIDDYMRGTPVPPPPVAP